MWPAILTSLVGDFVQGRKDKRKQTKAVQEVTVNSVSQQVTLIIALLPFVVLWVSPERVEAYFLSMSVIPDQYMQVVLGMVSSVWGMNQIKRIRAGL